MLHRFSLQNRSLIYLEDGCDDNSCFNSFDLFFNSTFFFFKRCKFLEGESQTRFKSTSQHQPSRYKVNISENLQVIVGIKFFNLCFWRIWNSFSFSTEKYFTDGALQCNKIKISVKSSARNLLQFCIFLAILENINFVQKNNGNIFLMNLILIFWPIAN